MELADTSWDLAFGLDAIAKLPFDWGWGVGFRFYIFASL